MQRVLQVNSHGQPLHFIDLMRAVALVWEEKATILVADDSKILRSPSWETPYPLVVMIKKYYSPLAQKDYMRPSRFMIFARDGWKCSYCDQALTRKTASLDHLIPRDWFKRNGKDMAQAQQWENLVASCRSCNFKKGNSLPDECNMHPRRKPQAPDPLRARWAMNPWSYHALQKAYIAKLYRLDPQTLQPIEQ